MMRVVVLAGGVGGAKLASGLSRVLPGDNCQIIVNTGDDFEYLGLKISPDLDTVCYTLADEANPQTGWGLNHETWTVQERLAELGAPSWFALGDRDLATHLFRTDALGRGCRLSGVTRSLCERLGITSPVYPMSDDPVRTIVHTKDGAALGFQDYFVHQACQPLVRAFEFVGAATAQPLPAAMDAIESADIVIVSPSNPWVSIGPILAIPGYVSILKQKPVIAISPLVGGKAIKGPAAKMYQELGVQPSSAAVASQYRDFLTGFVVDNQDEAELEKIRRWRIISIATDIVMKNQQDRIRLAEEILQFGDAILKRSR